MFKWIFVIFVFYLLLWILFWYYFSFYTPISKQIDVKTMSFSNPNYFYENSSICDWDCTDYQSSSSSSSSWGWGWGSSWK